MGNLTDIGYGVGKYLTFSDHTDVPQILDNTVDLENLHFKLATNNSYVKYAMVDGFFDAFQDTSGVDASASGNEIRDGTGEYYGSAVDGGNYFGTSGDGALTTSGNVTHTVQNKSGSYDGDMVVKQYSSLTIAAGHTMTVDQPCRGLFIYVNGNCTINGTLSMTAKGGLSNPTSSGGSDSNAVGSAGLQLGLVSSGGSSSHTNDGTSFNGAGTAVRTATANQANLSSNGTIFTISKAGGAGGASVGSYVPNGAVNANTGTTGTAGATGAVTISTGGGGAGGSWQHHGITGGPSGAGGTGGAFSSGAGGGSTVSVATANPNGQAGGNYGGAGGAGRHDPSATHSYGAAGGAGNPGGIGQASGGAATAPTGGCGGIIWLIVNGTLTVASGGSIVAQGSTGAVFSNNGTAVNTGGSNGGSSGGGAIFALSSGTFTNNGTISAAGGASAVTTGTNQNGNGGVGGAGGVHSGALIAATTYNDLTLISNTQTAVAAPTTGRLVIFEEAATGTTTINTDIKGWVSRDNGSNYDELTLVSQVVYATGKRILEGSIDFTMSASTNMRYKVTTHNQSVSKITRVHGASMMWY